MIPLFAPLRQNELLASEIEHTFREVLFSGEYILGKKVAEFEESLKQSLSFNNAVGCASGTEALVLAVKALDLPRGSEVITPSFSFVASTSSVVWAGYKPNLCDVDTMSGCVEVRNIDKAMTENTKAVIAVDLFGRQCDIENIRNYCKQKNLFLIEDGAQSIGVPNLGPTFYTTSFYPTKNIGAIGDAGAVLTDNDQLAKRVRELSRHGSMVRDFYPMAGTTGRLDTVQAAILSLKLEFMQEWSEARKAIADRYLEVISNFSDKCEVFTVPANSASHVWSLFTIRIPKYRNQLVELLKEKGIGVGVYYSKAIHEQPAFKEYGNFDCPNSTLLSNEVLSIPIFPELTTLEIDQICDSLALCLRTI
jgi:dTDP-4-amino-4,6-dideoxygalactose transaminase